MVFYGNEKRYFNQKLNNIRKGIYNFEDIGVVEWTEEIEKIILEDFRNKKVSDTDKSFKNLIKYNVKLIDYGKRKIEDIDKDLLPYVEESITKRNDAF